MDRRQVKIISALLALLLSFSPIGSLAMQSAAPDSHSGHCEERPPASPSPQHEALDHAQCTMENCAESCSASRHCSGQAPILLTLPDIRVHPGGNDLTINSIPGGHPSIHPPGLYRPPRS